MLSRTLFAMAIVAAVHRVVLAQSSSEGIEYALPRVVKIFGAGGLRNLAAYGSGFLVSPEGHVVTVWNHVLDSDSTTIVLNDGRRYQAKVLGFEPDRDLAVLKIDAEGLDLPYFELEGELSAGTGTRVLAFSNMFKVATGDEPVSVMHGVISARTKLSARRGAFDVAYSGPVYIVDSATNNTGAAGGALTTRDGRLLGMVGKELRNAGSNTWVHYAIPVTELADLVAQIREGKYKSSSDEGSSQKDDAVARYRPLDFGIVLLPDVVERTPAYIDTVLPESDAAKAGMQPDDLILFANDELVQSSRAFRALLGRLELGDTLKIVVRRKNRLETFEFTAPRKDDK